MMMTVVRMMTMTARPMLMMILMMITLMKMLKKVMMLLVMMMIAFVVMTAMMIAWVAEMMTMDMMTDDNNAGAGGVTVIGAKFMMTLGNCGMTAKQQKVRMASQVKRHGLHRSTNTAQHMSAANLRLRDIGLSQARLAEGPPVTHFRR